MCENKYNEFKKTCFELNGQWYGYFVCSNCENKIQFNANSEVFLNRNFKNKKICKKCSLKKQKGENNPFFGKNHTPDSINKISLTKSGVTTSDHMSRPEYKQLYSEMTLKRWKDGRMEETRKKLSELMKNRHANGELTSINRSKAEFEIIQLLNDNNVSVIPNFRVGSKIFDIYIPNYNLLIEYNGDYWHCNPNKYKIDYINKKKNKTAKEIWVYDKNKLDLAKDKGYLCEVIWETDYKKNKNIILLILKKYDKK